MKKICNLFHWETSLQFGSECVDINRMTSTLLSKDMNYHTDKDIILKSYNNDFLNKRKTIRNFKKEYCISFEKFSEIISSALSINVSRENVTCSYPSAGGLYPIRTYIIVNRVEKVEKGLYYYNPNYNSITNIFDTNNFFDNIEHIFLEQSFTDKNLFSFALIFILDVDSVFCKYGNRGYRYSLIEAGHIVQNIQIVCGQIDVCSVPVGGFKDFSLLYHLNLDRNAFLPLYSVFLGGR